MRRAKNELAIIAAELSASVILSILATEASQIPTGIFINLQKPQVTIIQDLRQAKTLLKATVEALPEAEASAS